MDTSTLTDTQWRTLTDGVAINGAAYSPQAERVLTLEALPVIAALHRALERERQDLCPGRDETTQRDRPPTNAARRTFVRFGRSGTFACGNRRQNGTVPRSGFRNGTGKARA